MGLHVIQTVTDVVTDGVTWVHEGGRFSALHASPFGHTFVLIFSSGCDSLHLNVNEAGALNVRTLGICVLPFAMFMDGFSGEVNFQKASSHNNGLNCARLQLGSRGPPRKGWKLELA